jgi:DNA primase
MYDNTQVTRRKQAILEHVEAQPLDCYAAVLGVDPSEFKKKGTEFYICCPLHKDQEPSLRVNADKGTWYCDPCKRGGDIFKLCAAMKGLSTGADFPEVVDGVASALSGVVSSDSANDEEERVVETYDYRDEQGVLLYQCVRYEPKGFKQRRPDGSGGWVWGLGEVRRVLYRLPELLTPSSDTVFICEGEKDVDSLCSLGLIATTNPMGAGKWRDDYNETLRGRHVIILPDNDGPGEKHAFQVAKALLLVARSVKIVHLPVLFPRRTLIGPCWVPY